MHKNDCISTVKGGISNSCVTICSHAVPMKISVVCFGFHAFLSDAATVLKPIIWSKTLT